MSLTNYDVGNKYLLRKNPKEDQKTGGESGIRTHDPDHSR